MTALETATKLVVLAVGIAVLPHCVRDIAAPGTPLPLFPGDAAYLDCAGFSGIGRVPTQRYLSQALGVMMLSIQLACMCSTFQGERSTMQILGLGAIGLAYVMLSNQEAWLACSPEADGSPIIAMLGIEGLLLVVGSVIGAGKKKKAD